MRIATLTHAGSSCFRLRPFSGRSRSGRSG
jgi:hypothetical protein